MHELDVVVSGAGIVGLAAAHTFARAGKRTLLIDPHQPADQAGRFGHDIRTVALSPVSLAQCCHLAESVPKSQGRIHDMYVWEKDGTAAISLSREDANTDCLAAVIENSTLVKALLAREHENLKVRFGAHITRLDTNERLVELSDQQLYKTSLLVVAEGSQSATIELLDVKPRIDTDLGQRAIATLALCQDPHRYRAWQIFAPTPLALLPCIDPHLVSVIWSVHNKYANCLEAMDELQFTHKLRLATESVLGEIQQVDKRVSFPLRQHVLSDFNPLPWVLVIGDAARTIHPLAGQGVNLGLEDVRACKQVLNVDPPRLDKPGLWRNFAAKRLLRSLGVAHLMSAFNWVYSADSIYLRTLRNAGVRWVNQNTAVKRQLIKEAMGLGPVAVVL